jgi:hypothetical protein
LGIGNWELEFGNWNFESESDKKYSKNFSKINNILSKNDMIKKRLLIPTTTPSFYYILNPTEFKQEVKEARQRGERIVMTNGCFYILQAGHERYFVWKLEIRIWELRI